MRAMFGATLGVLMLLSSLARGGAPTTARTTTSPSTSPSPPTQRRMDASAAARHPAIQSAIVELTKEIELALGTGEDAPRGQSDYFIGQTDIPPAAVIAALRRSTGGDVRVQAFVKWQLLSALPDALDQTTAGQLLQVYRAAQPPFPRPGIEKQQREELERMIRSVRESDAERLAEKFDAMVERVERDNMYLLAYRDQLFANLPTGYETLAAGLDDAAARVDVGADAADHVRNVCKAIVPWAAKDATPDMLRAMSRAVAQLEKKRGQPYFNKLYWSDGYGRMTFSKSRGSLGSVSQLEQAREFLDDKIRNPIVPLKLKEER